MLTVPIRNNMQYNNSKMEDGKTENPQLNDECLSYIHTLIKFQNQDILKGLNSLTHMGSIYIIVTRHIPDIPLLPPTRGVLSVIPRTKLALIACSRRM